MGPKRVKKLVQPVDCFICSGVVSRTPQYISKQVTKFTETPFTQVLSQVLDDEFYVVATDTDVVCKKCCDLINLRDKTSKILAESLKEKYKLRDTTEDVEQCNEQLVVSPKREPQSPFPCNHEEDDSLGPCSSQDINFKKSGGIEILASVCESQLQQEPKPDTLTTSVNFFCEFCDFVGSSSTAVVDHIQDKHNEVFGCDLCDSKFQTKSEITGHIENAHNFNHNTVSCLSCKVHFSNLKTFEEHKQSYIKYIENYCKACDNKFSSMKQYKNHCSTQHCELEQCILDDNAKTLHICKCCGGEFLNDAEFQTHCATHQPYVSSTEISNLGPQKKIYLVFQEGNPAFKSEIPKSHKRSKYKTKHGVKRVPPPVLSFSLMTNSHSSQLTTESRKIYECGMCSVRMNSAEDLKEHFKTHPTFNVSCKVCNLPFYSLFEYKHHQNYHWREGMVVTCETCKTNFNQKSDMIEHIKNVHHWQFECSFCEQLFVSKSQLSIHVKRHPENKSFVCSVCEARFSTLKLLTQHSTDNHTTPICTLCSKTFPSALSLKKHECSLDKTRPLLKCSYCSKQFKSRSGKRDHELTHTGEHKYKCEDCNKSFITKRVYNEHMNALHSEVPKTMYTCEICGSKFLHLYSYNAHKKVHGKFSYICEHCGKEINQPGYVKLHLRTHTGDKPFQCPYCEKRFNNGSYMRRHLMSHTKQYAYECQDCGKGFPARKPYLIHREKEHDDASYTETCEICHSLADRNDKSFAYVMHRYKAHGEQLPRKVATVKLGHKFDYNFLVKENDREEEVEEDENTLAVEAITTELVPHAYVDNIEGTMSQTIEITIETLQE